MSNAAYNLGLARIGEDVTIWPQAKIVGADRISIGNSVIIDDFVFLMGGQETTIGSFVHIASFTSITGGGTFVMGDFAGLSGGVRVYTGNEDYSGRSLTNPTVPAPFRVPVRTSVRIDRHAIVGANTVILPGVVIGEGAVVGANSLVTKNCEPWTVYFGSPAKAIKTRRKERIHELEAELRAVCYDGSGKYIPKARRS
jgi:acetyltransferase-like isoleucine patch superfamily enzyme